MTVLSASSTGTDFFQKLTTQNGHMLTNELTSHVTNLSCLSNQSLYHMSATKQEM